MDEVFLNAPDEYEATCFKTKGLLRWALDHGYSHVFKTDIDTLVNPVNLMNSGFEQHDFVGRLSEASAPPFASGGAGYWLSAKAMYTVLEQPAELNFPGQGGHEDVFVTGIVWGKNHIPLRNDNRYKYRPTDTLDKDTISFHITTANWKGRPYQPDEMYEEYAKMLALQTGETE